MLNIRQVALDLRSTRFLKFYLIHLQRLDDPLARVGAQVYKQNSNNCRIGIEFVALLHYRILLFQRVRLIISCMNDACGGTSLISDNQEFWQINRLSHLICVEYVKLLSWYKVH